MCSLEFCGQWLLGHRTPISNQSEHIVQHAKRFILPPLELAAIHKSLVVLAECPCIVWMIKETIISFFFFFSICLSHSLSLSLSLSLFLPPPPSLSLSLPPPPSLSLTLSLSFSLSESLSLSLSLSLPPSLPLSLSPLLPPLSLLLGHKASNQPFAFCLQCSL